MQVSLALKKIEDTFEAALIVDGKFARSASGTSPATIVNKVLSPLLSANDLTEIIFQVGLLTADEVARNEAREQRQRATAEAEAEAGELERLEKARIRELRARVAHVDADADQMEENNGSV